MLRAKLETNMLATTKVLHVSHLIAAKVLTGKAVIAGGLFAGTIAMGYAVGPGEPLTYVTSAAMLINNAAIMESPVSVADLPDAQDRQREAAIMASIDPSIPHLTVSAHRMTQLQKAEYDAGNKSATQLAKK